MSQPCLSRFTEFGRKIVGVGFNYKGLIKQMKVAKVGGPRLYLKAPSSYIKQDKKIEVPLWSTQGIWYEVELGVVIERPLWNANQTQARDAIGGYVTALDMTDKGRLLAAKAGGLPWAVSKSFPGACPVGNLLPPDAVDPLDHTLYLKVNREERQRGHSSDMTWSPVELLTIITRYMALERGDMVLCGTPEGMGAARPGDTITAGIEGVDQVTFQVDKYSSVYMEPS